MGRRGFALLVMIGSTLLLGQAGGPPQEPPPGSITWVAVWTFSYQAHGPSRGERWRIEFNGVQDASGARPFGGAQRQWLSRLHKWEYRSYSEHLGWHYDPRVGRFPVRYREDCTEQGLVALGASEGEHSEGLRAVQPDCVWTMTPVEPRGYSRSGRKPGKGFELEQLLDWPREGCVESEARREVDRDGSVTTITRSVTVSPYVAATAWVRGFLADPIHVHPGSKIEVEGESSMVLDWKFELNPVSRLRGYATNADVDSAFFQLYPEVSRLEGHYGTLSPDLIFDPLDYEEQWRAGDWKRPVPESGPRQWSTLESAQKSNRAFVSITAMDYGAHGELRAFVASGCGGGWLPVQFRVAPGATSGPTHISIPTDADGNFMDDRFERFRGVAPLADEDAVPKGDGTPGDGFSAFEEYRGFVKQTGPPTCDPLKVRHVRTDPGVKDLFVRAADPLLRDIVFDEFEDATGPDHDSSIHAHTICPDQYVDDQTRIVNFTMHRNPGAGIRGARLTQERPQHGLYLVNQAPGNGLLGHSAGFGPPRNVRRVAVDVPRIRAAYGPARFREHVALITVHELGHAIGIRHHGDGNITGPVVLLDAPGCVVGMTEGQVQGQPACSVTGIALRGQQNSGNASCPMKYIKWSWYVPPGFQLRQLGLSGFVPDAGWRSQPQQRVAYTLEPAQPTSASGGRQLRRYRKDLDEPPSAMEFCSSPAGTGVNALPMDQNHAGEASRTPACAAQIRVNDVPLDVSP